MNTNPDINELYVEVFPKGVLGKMLKSISNPHKHRWNVYLRACRAIPKTSPVHGTTDWNKINSRRHHLIQQFLSQRTPKDAEYLALQKIAGVAFCGSIVAQNFLMARLLRRLKRDIRSSDRIAPISPSGSQISNLKSEI